MLWEGKNVEKKPTQNIAIKKRERDPQIFLALKKNPQIQKHNEVSSFQHGLCLFPCGELGAHLTRTQSGRKPA